MVRHPGRTGWTGALGVFVLCTFGVGVISGPMRPCLNHPGHSGGDHHPMVGAGGVADAASMAQGIVMRFPEPATPGPDSPLQKGCDCLGQCHAEQSPFLASSAPVAMASDQAPVCPPVVQRASEPNLELEYPVPLARPPPSLSA